MIVSHCIPYVLHESHTLNVLQSRVHGLDHWFRVWQNAQMLNGMEHGADMEVVALFALFHDSMRVNDYEDEDHGARGYRLWERFCRTQNQDIKRYFSDAQEEVFFEACVEHNGGKTAIDPTIAVCWDADRLDLPRVGIWPDSMFMSTSAARSLTITRLPSKSRKRIFREE